MQEKDIKSRTNDFDNELDLLNFYFILAKGKKIIIYVSIFLFVIGIILSLMLPNIYRSEALLAPVDESSSLFSSALSQYGGIASLAGISLQDQDVGGNSKQAIELMNSLSFFENYMMKKIFLPDLMAVKSWDHKKNKIIYDDNIFQENSNTWVRNFSYPKTLIPSPQESYEVFKNDHFNIIEDLKTGYIRLSIQHRSPSIAKEWVGLIFEDVNEHFRQKDRINSEKAVAYLNDQMAKTSLSEIRQVTASILQKEIQKLTLIEANKDYVFEYIYPPSIMEEKSAPNRSFIIIFLNNWSLLRIYYCSFKTLFLRREKFRKKE